MPAGEALVSVRETASHTGQPTTVRPTVVVLLVRDRVVAQRLTVAFRPLQVQVVHCVSELRAAMAQHLGAVACVVAEARDSAHEPTSPALSALIQRFPAVPVLGYCGAGARHAADLEGLAQLRRRLRRQIENSPLFDAPRFAAHLQTALRGMWSERGCRA